MTRLTATVFALTLGALGCSGAEQASTPFVCGDSASFPQVSPVLEARCGTLDCHGSLARPLRVFGQNGLRLPIDFTAALAGDPVQKQRADEVEMGADEYYPGGGQPTTPSERFESYKSLCGLEPELTALVVQRQAEVDTLTLFRKMRLLEKHKGGRIFNEGQFGDSCIKGWLTLTSGTTGGTGGAAGSGGGTGSGGSTGDDDGAGSGGSAAGFDPGPCKEELKTD